MMAKYHMVRFGNNTGEIMKSTKLEDKLGHVITPLVTPFSNNGDVNYNEAEKLSDYLISRACCDSIIVAGTTGEFYSMSSKERIELFAVVKNAVNGRVPVVAGAGSAYAGEVVNLVKEAEHLSSLYDGNVTLACLETDSPAWVEVPSKTSLGKIAISSLVANADKVITIPVAKTHSWAQISLALKNFIGITPLSRYAQLIDNTWWNRGTFDHSSPQAIAQVYLDIVKSIKPDLSIIDFSIGIEGDGPTIARGGTTLFVSWLIIRAAVASTAMMSVLAMIAHEPRRSFIFKVVPPRFVVGPSPSIPMEKSIMERSGFILFTISKYICPIACGLL